MILAYFAFFVLPSCYCSHFSRFFVKKSYNSTAVQSQPFITQKDDKKSYSLRVGPLARGFKNLNTPSLPCCRDRFGEQSCQALREAQPAQFEKRCLNDHDFHTLGCCAECRKYIEINNIHPENSRSLLKAPKLCRDKHSLQFCRKFKAVGLGKFSCANADFAVRICRHTCGYCNDALYDGMKSAPLCTGNFATSLGPNYTFLKNMNF